jgi:predicted transposase/invertase (TIGR01784 family)
MRFVDVTNDIAFRKIFGNENKKISLISFLNAVINLPNGNVVTDVDILNPYQLPKLADGKSTILDVKARDKEGNTFIVEMQIAQSEYFHKRVLYYTSQSYTNQITDGIEYKKLYPVYFIRRRQEPELFKLPQGAGRGNQGTGFSRRGIQYY